MKSVSFSGPTSVPGRAFLEELQTAIYPYGCQIDGETISNNELDARQPISIILDRSQIDAESNTNFKKFELMVTGRAKAYSSSYPLAVTHRSTNRAWRRVTSFQPKRVPTTPRHQRQYRGATLCRLMI